MSIILSMRFHHSLRSFYIFYFSRIALREKNTPYNTHHSTLTSIRAFVDIDRCLKIWRSWNKFRMTWYSWLPLYKWVHYNWHIFYRTILWWNTIAPSLTEAWLHSLFAQIAWVAFTIGYAYKSHSVRPALIESSMASFFSESSFVLYFSASWKDTKACSSVSSIVWVFSGSVGVWP